MNRCLLFLYFLISFACTQALPNLVVFNFEPIGIEEKTNAVITKLIKDAFTVKGNFNLIEPPPDCQCYTPAPACSVAREIGAEKALIGSIMQLGQKWTISFQFINVPDSKVEFADKISTTVLEEMDVLTTRIVDAITEKKPITQTIEVGKVVETEVPSFKTREPFATITGRTGYIYGAYPRTSTGEMFTIESSVAYETKDLLCEALIGFRNGKQADGVHFDLLLHKILSPGDFSFYLGGGLGIHQITIEHYTHHVEYYDGYKHEWWDSKTDDGMAFSGGFGVLGFRTYFFRIMANARASLIFTGDFGAVPDIGFTFGITSPTFGTGKNSQYQTAGMCLGGCLALYVIGGLMASLSQ